MRHLTVVYDAQCGLCARLGQWMGAQPKCIQLSLVPSTLALRLYPALAPRIVGQELLVVSDESGVYVGDHAWLMCLYALQHYRPWAQRLSRPALLPLARQAFAILSGNRRRISKWLGLLSDAELTTELRAINPPRCYGTGA
jgi:predicted DCC family thiol-disulfide oxidoreductase YuxK